MKKKKIPLSESKPFLNACQKVLGMYATCTSDTKRCFIGGTSYDDPSICLLFFRGDVDDVFAVKAFLEERDEK